MADTPQVPQNEDTNKKVAEAKAAAKEAKVAPEVAPADVSAGAVDPAPAEPRRTTAAPANDTFTAAEWRQYARAGFKVSAYVIDGAVAGQSADRKYTKVELESLISNFLNRTAN